MRNYIFLLFLLLPLTTISQEVVPQGPADHRDIARNELSLNVFNVLIFGALDASYERILSRYSSLGIEFFSKKLNKNKGEDVDLSQVYSKEFSVTTKFKYFFSEEKTARGFYAEAFAMYSDGINEKEIEIEEPGGFIRTEEVETDYNDVALGFGVGGKFVSKKGFLIDLSFGLGRNMFHKDSPDLVVLPNINVGYRF